MAFHRTRTAELRAAGPRHLLIALTALGLAACGRAEAPPPQAVIEPQVAASEAVDSQIGSRRDALASTARDQDDLPDAQPVLQSEAGDTAGGGGPGDAPEPAPESDAATGAGEPAAAGQQLAAAAPSQPEAPPPADAQPDAGSSRSSADFEDPLAHPLSIQRMRGLEYPGSDLVFHQTLEPGTNHSRHVVSYQSEGLRIYALLTIPTGERPSTGWPVVIFNHGYIPPAQYRTTERYVAYVNAFARNGYMVLKSDYRGHGSSEGVASGGRGSPDYTIDVLNGMASVARHPEADPNRIGMWGHSMGGGITLRAMVVSDQIKAGVIWAGVVASYVDMFNRLGQSPLPNPSANPTRRGWRTDLIDRFGTPEENPEAWNAVTPNAFLSDISGPLQLHHGTNDTSVPVEYSAALQDQMAAAGKPSEYLVYDGDDHNLSGSLTLALNRSVEFFDRHVKNAGAAP